MPADLNEVVSQSAATSIPTMNAPDCQLVTHQQIMDPLTEKWTKAMGFERSVQRKVWERSYILQTLHFRGMLQSGCMGLGFGVGRDPMMPVMVNHGCRLLASDFGVSNHAGWGVGQNLNPKNVAPPDLFAQNVSYREIDMNRIPADLKGFDFLWSCGSLEHIGGLYNGLEFVVNAVKCLRPGGVAVHTTELNLSETEKTLDQPDISFYLPKHLDALVARVNELGYQMSPINYYSGNAPEDLHVASRPYSPPMLKAWHAGYTITSVGIVIRA